MKHCYVILLSVIVVSAIGAAQSDPQDVLLGGQDSCSLCKQTAQVQQGFPLVYEQLLKAQWSLGESKRIEQQRRDDCRILEGQLQAACQYNGNLRNSLEQEHLLRKKEAIMGQAEREKNVLLQKTLRRLSKENQELYYAWYQLQDDRNRMAWKYLQMEEAAEVDGRRADAATRALGEAHKNVRFLENELKCLKKRMKKELDRKKRAKRQLRTVKEQVIQQKNRVEYLESQLRDTQDH